MAVVCLILVKVGLLRTGVHELFAKHRCHHHHHDHHRQVQPTVLWTNWTRARMLVIHLSSRTTNVFSLSSPLDFKLMRYSKMDLGRAKMSANAHLSMVVMGGKQATHRTALYVVVTLDSTQKSQHGRASLEGRTGSSQISRSASALTPRVIVRVAVLKTRLMAKHASNVEMTCVMTKHASDAD